MSTPRLRWPELCAHANNHLVTWKYHLAPLVLGLKRIMRCAVLFLFKWKQSPNSWIWYEAFAKAPQISPIQIGRPLEEGLQKQSPHPGNQPPRQLGQEGKGSIKGPPAPKFILYYMAQFISPFFLRDGNILARSSSVSISNTMHQYKDTKEWEGNGGEYKRKFWNRHYTLPLHCLLLIVQDFRIYS